MLDNCTEVSLPLSPGFESQCARLSPPRCLTCLLGLQGVQWVRGLVVVRVSWPGHPGLPKKKEGMLNNFYIPDLSNTCVKSRYIINTMMDDRVT